MSTPAVYILEQLQGVMVSRLAADAMFNGGQSENGTPVPIITENQGDIVTEIDIKVGQMGICILVMTPSFKFINNLAPSLDGWATVSVDIFENVTLNQAAGGTKIRAVAAAQRVLGIMHHFPTGLYSDTPYLSSHFMGTEAPLQCTGEGPPLHYTVLFQAHLTLSIPQP